MPFGGFGFLALSAVCLQLRKVSAEYCLCLVQLALKLVQRVLKAIERGGDSALDSVLASIGAGARLLLPQIAAALDKLYCVSIRLG